MRYSKKLNRYEQREVNRQRIESVLAGDGVYLFQNRSEVGSLGLPKPDLDGNREVAPKGTFRGDSYFKRMLKTNEIILVEVITPGKDEQQETPIVSEQKLILDQPDQVTTGGKVEHVVRKPETPTKPANEENQNKPQQEVLLIEDPLAGVTILG